MKANENFSEKELMIGDWILLGNYAYNEEFDPYKVSEVMEDCGISVNEFSDIYEMGWFHPIPLTAEILEKNGFIRSMNVSDTEPFDLDEEGYAYYQFGTLGISIPHLWGWFKDGILLLPSDYSNSINIRYVHQLQHALRLCGLWELADNFKV